MNVASRVIEKFGGAYQLAELLGCRPSTIYRWTYSVDEGGTGGLVPQRHHITLLKLARGKGVRLRPSDLYPRQKDIAA